MTPKRQVYLLDPQTLSPETIAVTFAKTSRSPQSFREIAAELTVEKSAEFNEKWVVGYGHSSVAEHAVLHIAVENLSRLAVETLEGNRLASYTEKSTRYQKWDSDQFFIPIELENHPLREMYIQTCTRLFAAYQEALPAVRDVIAAENPRRADEKESAWEQRLRTQYVDVCRFLLPAASLANVGVTINARNLEYAISKMLSHPLQEVQTLGGEFKEVGQANVPTLVKYARATPYLREIPIHLADMAAKSGLQNTMTDWCQLVDWDHHGDEHVLAAALYKNGEFDYAQALEYVRTLSPNALTAIASACFSGCDKFDIPLRETEHCTYTFDLVVDQGAYFEIKRHRMMTQSPQALTTRIGYAVPRRMVLAGMESVYRQAMQSAADAYEALFAWNPAVASYVVPNGFNRRVLLSMNFRAADHFIALRTAANAHFSVRRVAQRMAEQIRTATPVLGEFLRVQPGETWQQIENEHFSAT